MRTFLVTGAAGLLGTYLVPLLARRHRVVAAARSELPPMDNVQPLRLDLSQPLDAARLPDRIDAVIYLAQSRLFRSFPEGAADMLRINVEQPCALIEEARKRGATTFVYASSGAVYAPSLQPLREGDPTPADGFYASSKLAAEHLLSSYSSLLNVVVLRYFFIYGRGQARDMLLPRLVDNVREGRPVTLDGGQGLRINPAHGSDAAAATAAALDLGRSAIINVAGPETVSIRAICEAAGRKLGTTPRFEEGKNPSSGDLVADTSRMSDLLAPPRVGLEQGLEDLL